MIATPEEQKLIAQIHIGAVVQHYKGKKMKILSIARHTENRELHVVYQKLYDCEIFGNQAIVIRPLKMFLENVVYNGALVPRFQVVKEHACC